MLFGPSLMSDPSPEYCPDTREPKTRQIPQVRVVDTASLAGLSTGSRKLPYCRALVIRIGFWGILINFFVIIIIIIIRNPSTTVLVFL